MGVKRVAGLSARLILAVLGLVLAGSAGWAAAASAAPKKPAKVSLMFSTRANRGKPRTLAGQQLAATRRVYVFLPRASGIASVSFYIDNPKMTGQPWSVATRAPYDLNGSQGRSARPFDLGSLADTKHTVTAAVKMRTGPRRVVSARFAIRPVGPEYYTRRVFDEEFNGKSINTSTWYLYSGPGNAGIGVRSPSAVSLDGHGDVVITASMASGQIVSGGLQQRAGFRYGHYEFRIKADADPANNTSAVALLWPASQNRIDGEMDVYETLTARRPIYVFLHDLVASVTAQDYFMEQSDATKWHTVAVDWQPKAISIYLDGVRTVTDTNPGVNPTIPHLFSMQLDPSNGNPLLGPVHMYVDYVRIFQ